MTSVFPADTYAHRRRQLCSDVEQGIILLLGNDPSPINFPANHYPFRQDSNFLYFVGLDRPGLAAVIDRDEGTACVFGDDQSEADIIWTIREQPLADQCGEAGIADCRLRADLNATIRRALEQKRPIHIVPPVQPRQLLWLQQLLGMSAEALGQAASPELIRAIVKQRSRKSAEEVAQIEMAIEVSRAMHEEAMRRVQPGAVEYELVGAVDGVVRSRNSRNSFDTIFTVHGEILHNPYFGNSLKEGDWLVHDSGAESPLHYASDITRTLPVSGRFSPRQREAYEIVLEAQERAMDAVRPGVEFREIHALAARVLLEGLKAMGLVKGDPEEAVAAGVHTLFFPCGLGHMMGLDVHDMEGLGEDYVGYTDQVIRNPEFGWRNLRLARALEPGFVITIEPGLYFNPVLMDLWKAEGKCRDFIDYAELEKYRTFGGVRVEDDLLVTETGRQILGPSIPRTLAEIEEIMGRTPFE